MQSEISHSVKRGGIALWCGAKSLITTLWRYTRHMTIITYRLLLHRLLPGVYRGSRLVSAEVGKINRSQNWHRACSSTMVGNAAGLGVAVLSTKIVESFVETREISNLWGLFASRPVVSEGTYEVFTFIVEYLLALFVFAITDYYVSEYRRRKAEKESLISTDNDS